MPRVLQLLGVNIQDKFEAALFEFLLLTDQPFALIKNKSFRKMVKVLNSRVNIYSITTLTRRITAALEEKRKKIAELLTKLQSKLSFILDV